MKTAPQLIAPDVHVVTVPGVVAANVYLIRSGGAWALVDAGWPASAEPIRTAVDAVLGPGAHPAAIVLTHLHPDHSGAAGALARDWGVPVLAHEAELPMAAGRYLPEYAMPLDRWVVVPLMRLLPAATRRRVEAAGDITDIISPLDADGIVPGLPDWRWVHTPGHTPGHVAYLRSSDGVLITGDAIATVDLNSFRGLLLRRAEVAGPPRYTTWNWSIALRSVEALAALGPRVLAPGHGRPLASAGAALDALARRSQGGVWGGLEPRYAGGTRYRRPPRWYTRLQRVGFVATWLGVSPADVVVLEVPGRRSGLVRRTNVVLVRHDGGRYVVALAGESEWVRNVRAAHGRVVVGRRGRRRAARLVEVPVADRPAVLRANLLRWGRAPDERAVLREASNNFGVASPALAELARVADRHPVFRVLPGWGEPHPVGGSGRGSRG
ncbi:nitroreductase/quinone reductase family protein [Georgenia satyanarayanai]|uniref:nitroreductase/quinone reductase family protein n=1 Tax=Georgenia satyanarayanai TaxID=860221 RepID=UPI001264D220|nr:nitroreductase/quinone reductase family protein [Georgenia satyanarayanai]